MGQLINVDPQDLQDRKTGSSPFTDVYQHHHYFQQHWKSIKVMGRHGRSVFLSLLYACRQHRYFSYTCGWCKDLAQTNNKSNCIKSKGRVQTCCLRDSSRRCDRAKCVLSLAKIYIHFASQCFLNPVTHLQHAALDKQQSQKNNAAPKYERTSKIGSCEQEVNVLPFFLW